MLNSLAYKTINYFFINNASKLLYLMNIKSGLYFAKLRVHHVRHFELQWTFENEYLLQNRSQIPQTTSLTSELYIKDYFERKLSFKTYHEREPAP